MEWVVKAVNRRHTDFTSDDNKEWKEPFIFVQGADSQLGLFSDYEQITTEPVWAREIELTELAIKKVNEMQPKPKFFVICGDLCNAFYDKTPELRAEQDADLKRILCKLDSHIPLVCICGNHDVGDNPTVNSINKYKSNYGDDYFSFFAGGIFFICINSQLFHGATLVPDQIAAQEQWIDSQLEIARGSSLPSIMFQHVPWFSTDPESKELNYFEINYDTRKKMLEKLHAAGVKYVFCGHLHQNSGGRYRELEVVVTTAIGKQLGSDQSGLRVVKVYQDRVEHKYYPLSQVPATVDI